MAHDVLEKSVTKEPLLEIALKLEEVALKEDYFIDKKLYPNVDFYSGLIYKALNFPVNMFPVMFAMGRLPGWIAQWKELQEDDDFRIGRPRQIYTGAQTRDYISIKNR
jgi:citrate synthase